MLAKRSQDIKEMAVILTEKKNPTRKEVDSMTGIATQVVDDIEYALNLAKRKAAGEIIENDFEERLNKLIAEAEEMGGADNAD